MLFKEPPVAKSSVILWSSAGPQHRMSIIKRITTKVVNDFNWPQASPFHRKKDELKKPLATLSLTFVLDWVEGSFAFERGFMLICMLKIL